MDWASIGQAAACIAGGGLALAGGRPFARLLYRDPRGERRVTSFMGWVFTGWGGLLVAGGLVVLTAQLLGIAPEEW